MSDKTGEIDELILNLLATDNVNAPILLYKFYSKPVFKYVRGLVKDSDAAKDIVQELISAIWEKRHTLNLISPLQGYLISAAHNKAINYLRDETRRKKMLGESVNRSQNGKAAPSADADLETRELAELIEQALALLPPIVRRTFLMSRDEKMTYKEIARHFQVTEKAVEKNMTKALALLRNYLKDNI